MVFREVWVLLVKAKACGSFLTPQSYLRGMHWPTPVMSEVWENCFVQSPKSAASITLLGFRLGLLCDKYPTVTLSAAKVVIRGHLSGGLTKVIC